MSSNSKTIAPAPDCIICGRSGVSMKYLGLGQYRHEDCGPGSVLWCEWYDLHPELHTAHGDILRHAKRVGLKG